jgi:peptide subunit release factor 1 (eRF1)
MIKDRALWDSLVAKLDRLARFESATNLPVLSLYLDARPDSHGSDHYQPFVRKELAARQKTYPLRSPERKSFDLDMEKIQSYLEKSVLPSTNGIAIYACAGEGGFFDPLQLPAAFEENRFSVGNRPQLFPLARLIDENPRYTLVLADTRTSQIFVLAGGFRVDETEVKSKVLPRTHGTGLSQMRYQRHVDNMQKHHARELVERLDRIVEEDRVEFIVLAGNDAVLPLIRSELSKRLADKVVDNLHFDRKRPVTEILAEAQQRLRERDLKTDAEKVERLLGEYRAGGLAVVGPEETRRALERGQADELLISATFDHASASADETAGDLLALARRTDTRVTFIEDPHPLEPVGGVGAHLRYRLSPSVTDTA